jgi:division protein CdvB (Snf7/Vps24/ESCRT-III family)
LQKNIYKNERDMKKRNRYLKELESVYTLKRKADKISLQIETDMERVDEINKQINEHTNKFVKLMINEHINK